MNLPLDDLDLRILAALQQNGVLANQVLAERVRSSPATTLRRIRRLTDTGIIERMTAVLSPEKLGPLLTAIVEITLDQQNAERFAIFEQLLRRH